MIMNSEIYKKLQQISKMGIYSHMLNTIGGFNLQQCFYILFYCICTHYIQLRNYHAVAFTKICYIPAMSVMKKTQTLGNASQAMISSNKVNNFTPHLSRSNGFNGSQRVTLVSKRHQGYISEWVNSPWLLRLKLPEQV